MAFVRRHSPYWNLAATVILGLIGILMIAELVIDYLEGASFIHMIFDFGVSVGLLTLAIVLTIKVASQLKTLESSISETKEEASTWKAEARRYAQGLSHSIEKQFGDWKLTKAQNEIGFLLLKGLSFKEIADIRGTSERTVRQQALEIYKKANVTGRAEFSAYFLEDLFAPISGAFAQPSNFQSNQPHIEQHP